MSRFNDITRNILRYKCSQKSKPNFGKYEMVSPALVSPQMEVPNHIKKPYYYKSGILKESPVFFEIKNSVQIDKMKKSCLIASSILKDVESMIQVGTSTDDIDKFVHNKCIENNAYPSPLWYNDFPKSVCTSVNNVVVHGIPDNRKLLNGDIVNVDITVYLDGFHGDCSKTFLVGDVDEQGKELVFITEECLQHGISVCGPGVPFNIIGHTIENYALSCGYTVIPSCLGHGIGTHFHEPPEIYHIKNTKPGKMKEGMTFTIEPVITQGCEIIEILEDGWTAVTIDGARVSQKEHTVLITENGCTILTEN